MIGFDVVEQSRAESMILSEGIGSLSDRRLMLIDPTVPGFFDKVLQYSTTNNDINLYIEAVYEIKEEANLTPFWRPIMDPRCVGYKGEKVIFDKRLPFAGGRSYNWWKHKAKKMKPVEGNIWKVGNIYQYYADQVDIINKCVDAGYELRDAIAGVVLDSEILNPKPNNFSATGSSYELCGRYDLLTTNKILDAPYEGTYGFFIGGGNINLITGNLRQMAELEYSTEKNLRMFDNVAWLVLIPEEHFDEE